MKSLFGKVYITFLLKERNEREEKGVSGRRYRKVASSTISTMYFALKYFQARPDYLASEIWQSQAKLIDPMLLHWLWQSTSSAIDSSFARS
jgi:hypothetical protein